MNHSFLVRRIAIASLAVSTLCCTSTSLHAAPNRPRASAPAAASAVLQLDVIDRSGSSASQTVKLSMPISERGSSTLESRAGGSEYRVAVHREAIPDGPAPLNIDLRRIDMRKHEHAEKRSDVRLTVSVHLQRGQRALVSRLERPDGSSTEIVASLR